jgi:hypothetical protein
MSPLAQSQVAGRPGEDVEDDFVSPLTMIRGVLELLRDNPGMPKPSSRRFLGLALDDCDRLGESINRLIENNPDFVKQAKNPRAIAPAEGERAFENRILLLEQDQIADVDFSDHQFNSSADVNMFHDVIDRTIAATGLQWYIMVNFRNCTIEPPAWGAFAHRGQQTNKAHSLGTVRYAVPVDTKPGLTENDAKDKAATGMFLSRQAAIDYLRKERAAAR